MARPFALLPAASEKGPGLRARLQAFLLGSLAGRILLVALAVYLLAVVVPLPGPLSGIATASVWAYALWGAFRLSRHLLRRLLWRIRSKLILSYLFIALVPVLLLTLLFFIASVLGSILVAGHLVNERMAEAGRELRAASEAALADLPRDDREAAAALEARLLRPSRAPSRPGRHPDPPRPRHRPAGGGARGPARVVEGARLRGTGRLGGGARRVPHGLRAGRAGPHPRPAPRPEAVRSPRRALGHPRPRERARSRRRSAARAG